MKVMLGISGGVDSSVAALLLQRAGHEVEVVAAGIDWPDAGRAVGEAVAGGRAEVGVVWCWTGTGVAMAAGKVGGVRPAGAASRSASVRVIRSTAQVWKVWLAGGELHVRGGFLRSFPGRPAPSPRRPGSGALVPGGAVTVIVFCTR